MVKYSESMNSQTYPYVDIVRAPSLRLVASLERKVNGTPTALQTFFYRGAVSHLTGLGFQGFQGVARSNKHSSNADRTFTHALFDVQKRGAMTLEYQSPYSVNLRNVPSDYYYKNTLTYQSSLSSNKVFKLWNTSSKLENRVKGTTTYTSNIYDDYLNLKEKRANYSGDGSSVTQWEYENNTSGNYYIGRPISQTVTSTVGSESFPTSERYTYSGNLISLKEVRGNGTSVIRESYDYDAYGNMIRMSVTPEGETPRTTTFTYDPSHRIYGRDDRCRSNIQFISLSSRYGGTVGRNEPI